MGCWGITAFELDEGLDAVELIRESIPEDGKLEPETLVETLKRDPWNTLPEVETAGSHTSVMVLAKLMLKFVDGDVESPDSEEDWNRKEHKFCSVTFFTASKETVHWIRNYLFDTLHHVKEHAGSQTEDGREWGGWFEEKNWIGWQEYMTELVSHLDTFLESSEAEIELITSQKPKYQEIENNRETKRPLQNQFEL